MDDRIFITARPYGASGWKWHWTWGNGSAESAAYYHSYDAAIVAARKALAKLPIAVKELE